MTALLVFACTFVAEACWTRWAMAAAAQRAAVSAHYAAGLVAIGGLTTLAYQAAPWYVGPAVLGAWCGTYWSVRRG